MFPYIGLIKWQNSNFYISVIFDLLTLIPNKAISGLWFCSFICLRIEKILHVIKLRKIVKLGLTWVTFLGAIMTWLRGSSEPRLFLSGFKYKKIRRIGSLGLNPIFYLHYSKLLFYIYKIIIFKIIIFHFIYILWYLSCIE